MSNVERFVARKAKETAVYWANPVQKTGGQMKFDLPVEIKCLWVDVTESLIDENGREVATRAVVYVLEDIDEHGMLYRGDLETLKYEEGQDPRQIPNAYEVKRFMKLPSLQKGFARKVMLSDVAQR